MSASVLAITIALSSIAITGYTWWIGRGLRADNARWVRDHAHAYTPSEWATNKCGYVWWDAPMGMSRQGLVCERKRRDVLHRAT